MNVESEKNFTARQIAGILARRLGNNAFLPVSREALDLEFSRLSEVGEVPTTLQCRRVQDFLESWKLACEPAIADVAAGEYFRIFRRYTVADKMREMIVSPSPENDRMLIRLIKAIKAIG